MQYSLKRYRKFVVPVIALLVVTEGASILCKADFTSLWLGIVDGLKFIETMFPPEWSSFGDMIEPAFQSILIAFLGTVFGAIVSIFFAVFASSNITYKWLRNTTRFMIGFERSLPEIIQGLLLIAAFGLGSMPAIIVLSLGCIGMLGKLLADAIEDLDPVMLESMQSVGANKIQILVFGVLPQIMPNLVSYTLLRFDINIRLSVILGALGAGGIGYQLEYSFGMLQYHKALTALIVIIIIIFGTEQLSQLLRNKVKMEEALK